jgi:hypothetical protein
MYHKRITMNDERKPTVELFSKELAHYPPASNSPLDRRR